MKNANLVSLDAHSECLAHQTCDEQQSNDGLLVHREQGTCCGFVFFVVRKNLATFPAKNAVGGKKRTKHTQV